MDWLTMLERPAFAVLYRPHITGPDAVEVLSGSVCTPGSLAEVPVMRQTLALIPFRQVSERGFACREDGAPLIAMPVLERQRVGLAELLAGLPDITIAITGARFDVEDDAYAELVGRVITDEIGTGAGANFVIKRSFVAEITGYTLRHALSFFRRLLEGESGAYWTFLVHTGERTFVGATPERHVSCHQGTVVMNPISGTYRYPPTGPNLGDVIDFLADGKETDELYMVLDEELKMMARICDHGGRVVGPFLREMARLAHTEYLIEGSSTADPRDILRETMFAPTVTGSPVESAFRVISRYEPEGRAYYGGIIALIGSEEEGGAELDSAILIRTADIDGRGRLRISVGATLVRHSDPVSEAAETRTKAAGLLSALQRAPSAHFGQHPCVREALAKRNETIAQFWLRPWQARTQPDTELVGLRILVVDAQDNFTSMIDHQLRSMGLTVTVRRFDEEYHFEEYDVVMFGPGPGDPTDMADLRIRSLRQGIDDLLTRHQPFLAVCLSHQLLSRRLGLPLVRRAMPNQGVQREIDLFGTPERVGFYNTFAAHSSVDRFHCAEVGMVEVSRDRSSGEVHGLRGRSFASMQFHAESVLTENGVGLIAGRLREALRADD
jgi:phenazine biosynthesis protein phzE